MVDTLRRILQFLTVPISNERGFFFPLVLGMTASYLGAEAKRKKGKEVALEAKRIAKKQEAELKEKERLEQERQDRADDIVAAREQYMAKTATKGRQSRTRAQPTLGGGQGLNTTAALLQGGMSKGRGGVR